MQAALAEARNGVGRTHPNPAVGAVIVRKGRIVGRGWHRKAGQPHAEIEAIRSVSSASQLKGATIYITLEPCSTHGRTPPCTEAIKRAGFVRVVYGATDPNPKHAGVAKQILEEAEVEVISGVLEKECTQLNEAWNKWIVTKLPFVIAKAGMTLDGRIGSLPGGRWITSPASREDAMQWRAISQAILVGGETVRVDNPKLTLRGLKGYTQPLRVVWSRSGRIPQDCRLLTDRFRDKTIVFKGKPLRSVLNELGKMGVACVLIEGGGRTLGEAFDRKLVDRALFYTAPILGGGPVPAVGGQGVASPKVAWQLEDMESKRIGDDLRVTGKVIYEEFSRDSA